MADRFEYKAPTIFTQAAPQVQTDDGTADYLKTKASVFLNNANEAHKRQLGADLELAKTEGERLGYSMGAQFKPQKTGSLFARTFNESGVFNASQKISMQTQRKVKELAAKNPANPTGLQQQLEKWKEGFAGELPDELATPFSKNFDEISFAAVENAKAQAKAAAAAQAAADFYAYDREVTNTMENLAPLAFNQGPEGDAARRAIATLRQDYAGSLTGNGPEGEYSVGGYKIKGAAGRSGAFTPLEIAKKLQGFDNQVIGAGVFGNFQEEVKAGRGVEAYMAFAKGDMEVSTVDKDGKLQSVKISDVLTNDEMEEVAGKMRTFIGGMNSVEEGEYRQWERGRERYNDQLLRDAYGAAFTTTKDEQGREVVIGSAPMAVQGVLARVLNDPMVKPETIDKISALADKLGTGEIDNPITTGETWTAIGTGQIADYSQIPEFGVGDQTRVKMMNAIDSRVKGQHWTNSQRYKIAQDYADAVLAPEKSAGFSLMGDPNSASAADRAEWNKRMIEESLAAESAGLMPSNPNAMPAQGQFDFVAKGREIADSIAAKRNAPAAPEVVEIDTKIKAVKEQMNNPKPGDDIDAIAERYKQLNAEKTRLQTRQATGAQ